MLAEMLVWLSMIISYLKLKYSLNRVPHLPLALLAAPVFRKLDHILFVTQVLITQALPRFYLKSPGLILIIRGTRLVVDRGKPRKFVILGPPGLGTPSQL